MKDYSEYSVEDFNRAFMRFYEALTYGKQPVKSPTAFLLGGQGGSGKSSVHEYLSFMIFLIASSRYIYVIRLTARTGTRISSSSGRLSPKE